MTNNFQLPKWFDRSSFAPGSTISLWVKPNTITGAHAVITKVGAFQLQVESGKFKLYVATSSGGGGWNRSVEIAMAVAPTWYHVTFWIHSEVEIGLKGFKGQTNNYLTLPRNTRSSNKLTPAADR